MLIRHVSPVLLSVSILAGCGGSDPVSVDAAAIDAQAVDTPAVDAPVTGDFTCLGQPLPTTAPDPLVIMGTAQHLNGLSTTAAAGVALSLVPTGNGAALSTATSGVDGTFTLTAASGGHPVDAYVKATKGSYMDYYLYPGAPLAAAVGDAPALILDAANLTTIDQLAGVPAPADPVHVGLLGVVLQDCAGDPVVGATIAVKQSGAAVGLTRYVAGSLPSQTAVATDSRGAAFVFNVPEGVVTVSAMVGGMNLRAHDVRIYGGATHATQVVP